MKKRIKATLLTVIKTLVFMIAYFIVLRKRKNINSKGNKTICTKNKFSRTVKGHTHTHTKKREKNVFPFFCRKKINSVLE